MKKKIFSIGLLLIFCGTTNAQEKNLSQEIVSSFKNIDYQPQEKNNVISSAYAERSVEHWKKIRNAGRILTGAGVGTVLLSGLIAERSLNDAFSGRNGDGVFLGAASMVLGFIATGTGITMWTVGGIRYNKAKKQNLSFQQTSPTSAGLVYKF